MSNISVNYTPSYTGPHRICYRKFGQTDYCCLEDNTPSVPNVPKIFVITISDPPCESVPGLSSEACTNQSYEGYVQDTCEELTSTTGRVEWAVTFTPDPSCVHREVCCITEKALETGNLVILDPGNGYTVGAHTVTVVRDTLDTASPATDAVVTATALVGGGPITSLAVISGGNYNKVPTFIIEPPTLAQPVQATMIANVPCLDVNNTKFFDTCFSSESATYQLGECRTYCFPKDTPGFYDNPQLTVPVSTDEYSNIPSLGCCNCVECFNYLVTYNGQAPTQITYTSCTTDGSPSTLQTIVLTPGEPTEINCLVQNSLFDPEDPTASFTVEQLGPCSCS